MDNAFISSEHDFHIDTNLFYQKNLWCLKFPSYSFSLQTNAKF